MAQPGIDCRFYDDDDIERYEISTFALMWFISAICYSAEHLTDGFISHVRAKKLPGCDIDHLVRPEARQDGSGGPWVVEVEGGYRIRNYLKYNKSREQIEAREARREQMLHEYEALLSAQAEAAEREREDALVQAERTRQARAEAGRRGMARRWDNKTENQTAREGGEEAPDGNLADNKPITNGDFVNNKADNNLNNKADNKPITNPFPPSCPPSSSPLSLPPSPSESPLHHPPLIPPNPNWASSKKIDSPAPAEISERWEKFRSVYPKRLGDSKLAKGRDKFCALLKSGVDAKAIIAGAERYRALCEATGKVRTELVQQVTTWLNGKAWLEEFELPSEESKPEPDEIKFRKEPKCELDYHLKDSKDGYGNPVTMRFWIREGERTDERFNEHEWRRLRGLPPKLGNEAMQIVAGGQG